MESPFSPGGPDRGKGDRHLEDSEPVPFPSASPFSYTL
jgi:hypothetical protein